MTRNEIVYIMSILKIAYPRFYANMTKEEAEQTVNLWAVMFEKDNARIVTEAVKSMIVTLKFPPTIADIKEKVNLITQPQGMTEMEAWNLVLHGIKDSSYNAQKWFDSYPEVIQKVIGSPTQLREWGLMDATAVSSVVQSNFMRSYSAKVRQEREYTMLPESTKALIDSISNGRDLKEISNTEESRGKLSPGIGEDHGK